MTQFGNSESWTRRGDLVPTETALMELETSNLLVSSVSHMTSHDAAYLTLAARHDLLHTRQLV
ncbi:hypothetical protein CCR75_003746 [Bremia lactucae]|uniref:Uncharacterized protein n=1 Tax=Bremia lactucae TaxID=4779 RepID=A0A976FKK7_BRELC|nr:hypothetical protein CCR75_003746 [Bremia lactucae]